MTFFKHWLFLNENIEENFNKWLELAFQYAKGNEKRLLRPFSMILMSGDGNDRESVVGVDPKTLSDADKESLHTIINQQTKDIIKNVLKEKNIENYNWFSFSLGFSISKRLEIHQEDLELAVDVTKQRIDSGELPKSEIGTKGWMMVGYESQQYVDAYITAQQELSNRAKLKMKKKGETLGDDERYVRLIDQEKNIKVYFIPAIAKGPSIESIRQNARIGSPLDRTEPDEKTLKERQMILCKYGKGTVWCTANPKGTYHVHYAKNNIYTIHIDDKPAYQFVDCKDSNNHQFMDVNNTAVKELEGDVYDILNKNENLKSKIKCYDLSRSYSFEEFMSSENEEVYRNISAKNIILFLERIEENQIIEVLRNLIKYKGYDWFESRSRLHSRYALPEYSDLDRLLKSFIKKLGSQKVVDEFSEKLPNNVLKNVILNDPGNIYQTVKDNIDVIKKSNMESNIIELIINAFGPRDPSNEREKTLELLGPEVLNNLDEYSIEKLVKENGFNKVFEMILNNRTKKITGSLIEFIFKTSLTLESLSYQFKFLKWLLSKDISTSSVAFILKRFIKKVWEEQPSDPIFNRPGFIDLKSVFELIGSDRITKIKKQEIMDIIEEMEYWLYQRRGTGVVPPNKGPDKREELINLIKQYHKKLNLSSEGSK